MSGELPAGWTSFTLAHIGGVTGGKTPSKANPEFWSSPDVPWISPKDMKKNLLESSEDRISQIAVNEAGMTLYPAGAVLIVTRSGILQHTLPVALAGVELTVNQDVKVIRPIEGIDPKFLFYLIKNFGGKILSACVKEGTTVQSIDSSKLEAFQLPLPPAIEQSRIVQKIDELLAQVDTLKARIDAMPALLKRFRQSVLAAAVSGRLTEEWRKEQNLSCPKSKKFEDLLKDKNKLSYGVLKPGDTASDGVPMVRVMDIGEWGQIDQSNIYKISKPLADEFKRTILEKDDILLSVMATIGRAAITPESLVGGNVNRAIAVIKLGHEITSEFAFFQIMSPQFQSAFVEKQLGSAQKRINLSDLREFIVPLPEISEQHEVVRRIQQLFAFADQLEARVASATIYIDNLTQSILSKAFSGKLVPQDPCNEPASELLARIQAQRSAAKAKAIRGRINI
ncbi:restriction endonuclease subunit S [Pseudomonas sp. B24_DOA]|nr:restriction endonuclease subunit S [Pseudomonas sp. B24_DOA]WKV90197.1 restriction endonuclease subunit S [Pseudomonas sp. B21_DOA]